MDGSTHTTICLRPSRGLRMNFRVRRVTGASESAMVMSSVVGCRTSIDLRFRQEEGEFLLVFFAGQDALGSGWISQNSGSESLIWV